MRSPSAKLKCIGAEESQRRQRRANSMAGDEKGRVSWVLELVKNSLKSIEKPQKKFSVLASGRVER